MARIELSIASDYVPRWGLWEGFREIVSNARDAEKEYSAPMEIDYADGKIKVRNVGCTLSAKALLLGASTKTGRAGMIGQWGEGLKLALLALTRMGHKVKVRSGAEVWVPRLVASDRFDGATILVVDISKGREPQNRVQVEIDGVSAEAWADLRRNILWLDARTTKGGNDKVLDAGDYGQILMEPRHRGRIYVSGVYVQSVADYECGYNFAVPVELDRDRKMIADWNRKSVIAHMWAVAAQESDAAMAQALRMLSAGADEIASMQHLVGYDGAAKAVAKSAAVAFTARYGADAVPVANLEQAKDLEHLGVRGIVVPEAAREVLKVHLGDIDAARDRFSKQVVRTLSWVDLSPLQQANLTEAIEMVNLSGTKVGLAEIDVVEFRDSHLLGQHRRTDDRILLAAKVVGEWRECLRVLIHEVAHRAGDDGDKGHVHAIEQTWAHLIEKLWR